MLLPILLGLVVLLALFLVFVATRPAEFSITRAAVIPASPEAVFAFVNDFHLWERWSPWAKMDPNCKNTFTGAASGVGAQFGWSGNNQVGEGHMTITASRPARRIELDLIFSRPMKATNLTVFQFEPAPQGTRVTWTMSGRNGFVGKLFGVIINCDKMVGGQFEQGLANLTTAVSNR